ncbi:MAG: PepSY-like domain-containing protein [Chitinophagaceae bacterium]|nr:PepSY-like domain-containing protein [Chitinophagaceae bacterium]MCW5929091.1 PepSY-like domain-containing protein [Chitinophagaceae bacterium]
MKNLSLILLSFALVSASCEKEKIVSENDLPATGKNYITTHFPDQKIAQAIKEFDDLKKTYKVYLDNGVKLEFNRSGEIRKIEGNSKLPDSVIPSQILTYVTDNYPAEYIKKWELDDNRQEVELSNGLDLEFDRNGNFLRIDD